MFFNMKPKIYNIYDSSISHFGNIYCNNVTYVEDNIDLNKVPNLYVRDIIYDGYDFEEEYVILYYSMSLLNNADEYWGCISVEKMFDVQYNRKPEGVLDYRRNLTSNRLLLTHKFPFKMTSMFYKEDGGFFFYVKSSNEAGIYLCIHIDFKAFILMQAVMSNLCYRLPIEHKNFLIYNTIYDFKKENRIPFIRDFKVLAFTLAKNSTVLIILLSINETICIYFVNIGVKHKRRFISKCADNSKYIEYDKFVTLINTMRKQGNTIFLADNIIRTGYLKNIENSEISDICTSYYCLEDLNYYLRYIDEEDKKDEDYCIKYIQFDEPAVISLHERVENYINLEIGAKVSIV